MEFIHDKDKECFVESVEGVCSPLEIFNKLKKSAINFNAALVGEPPAKILEYMKSKYKCDSEICTLKQEFDSDEINKVIAENFKPEGPKYSKAWLSNEHIDNVLDQIVKKYEDKKCLHLPFVMRDQLEKGSEMADLDFAAEYEKGYRMFCCVYNTDKSSGRGIHWLAIMGDFNAEPYSIEYFNSSGELPQTELSVWMKRKKQEWSRKMDKKIDDVVVTRIENQKNNYACGTYALYYILSRLEGVTWQFFRTNQLQDKKMNELREYLFREE